MFNDKFYPEAYVVSAMANVIMCEFNESRAAINRFIEVNRHWAVEIEKNLKDPKAQPINHNFFIANLEKAKSSLMKEKEQLISRTLNFGCGPKAIKGMGFRWSRSRMRISKIQVIF